MKNKNFRQLLPVAALMLAFALLVQLGFLLAGKWALPVLLGGLAGTAIALGYYCSLVLAANAAAKKAQAQDVKGGQALLRTVYPLRLLLTFGALLLCCISKQFNILALLLPMVLIQPAMMLAQLIQRKEAKA